MSRSPSHAVLRRLGNRRRVLSAGTRVPWCCGFVLLALWCSAAWADALRHQIRLPEQPQSADGFTLDLSCEDAAAVGYVGVRVRAQPTSGAFPAERTLHLQLTPVGHAEERLGRYRTGVRLELSFAQGAKQYEQTFFVPKYTLHGAWRVEVLEEGHRLAGYEGELGQLQYLNAGEIRDAAEVVMRTGVIVADEVLAPKEPWQRCPDLRSLDIQLNPPMLQHHDLTVDLTSEQRLAMLPHDATIVDRVIHEAQLSDSWKDYSALDLLLVPLPLLERLAERRPERWQAIRQWVSSGGNLWVFAAESPERLAGLFETSAERLRAESAEFDKARRAAEVAAGAWRGIGVGAPSPSDDASLAPVVKPSMLRQRVGHIDRELTPSIAGSGSSEAVWLQPYFAGAVFAIADEDPFPGSPILWGTAAELAGARMSACARRGVDPVYGSVSFWEWVLPDVAQPPVYSFLAILGAFAFLVGPVAFYQTARTGRGYLMFLIAPALAVLTTLLMFGYGVLADGLANKGRVRQLTWVDGSSGHGVRWSRSTYFAGLRQGDGLNFPAHAAVYPYPRNTAARELLRGGTTELPLYWASVGPHHQRFEAQFLPTRQLCQFVSVEPSDELGRLTVAAPEPGRDRLAMRNRFGFDLQQLIFRDGDGAYWSVDSLPSGSTKKPVAIDATEAMRRVRTWYIEAMPAVPEGFDLGNPRLTAGISVLAYIERKHGWGSQVMRNGIFEFQMQSVTQLSGALPPKSFFGLASFTPEMLALRDVELDDSVHFVMGTVQ